MSAPIAPAARSSRRALDASAVAFFALSMAAPSAAWLARGVRSHAVAAEERVPALFPPAPKTAAEISRYPAALQAWHADHLGLRAELLSLRSALTWHVFRRSPTPVADLGPNRWMILTELEARSIHRGTQPLAAAQLSSWRRAIESRARFCAEHGVRYLFVIGPNKSTIYPDELPRAWRDVVGPSRLAQLAHVFASDPDAPFLDVRSALLAARAEDSGDDLVYYPLGSHWTDRGALVATRAILERLRSHVAGLEPVDAGALTIEVGGEGDDWRARLYLAGLEPQQVPAVVRVEGVERRPPSLPKLYMEYSGPDPSAPSLLCFHDSFGDAPQRFLAHAFATSRFVWDDFDADLVERARPSVVLEIYVERVLGASPPAALGGTDGDLARAFADGEPLVSLPRDADRFLTDTGVSLSPRGAYFEIDFTLNPRGLLKLPAIDLAADRAPVVRIELDAPRAGSVFVFAPRPRDREYDRSRMHILPFPPGAREILCRVDEMSGSGRIALLFSPTTEVWTVDAIEVRAVPR